MMREISVHELDHGTMFTELRHVSLYLLDMGCERCEVLFGWHWGMDYYLTSKWSTEPIPLAELEAKVRRVEDTGIGRLGGDDLWVKAPGLDCEFCFCHHAGIHLTYSKPGQVAKDFVNRWRLAGLLPFERNVAHEH